MYQRILCVTLLLLSGVGAQELPPVWQPTPVLPIPSVSEATSREWLIHRVAPVRPGTACVQGDVVLRVLVNEAGQVSRVTPLSGPEPLRSSATNAVKQWVYQPFSLNGKPVPYTTQATLTFALPKHACPTI